MTLEQVGQVRHWLSLHGRCRPVEQRAWDLVLMLWVMAWVGVPVTLAEHEIVLLLLCFAALPLPTFYAALRIRMHRRGALRCDWLTALRAADK